MDLIFDLRTAYEHGATQHPQEVMKALGITYKSATPESIADVWVFRGCENVPDELPPYLRQSMNEEAAPIVNEGTSALNGNCIYCNQGSTENILCCSGCTPPVNIGSTGALKMEDVMKTRKT